MNKENYPYSQKQSDNKNFSNITVNNLDNRHSNSITVNKMLFQKLLCYS